MQSLSQSRLPDTSGSEKAGRRRAISERDFWARGTGHGAEDCGGTHSGVEQPKRSAHDGWHREREAFLADFGLHGLFWLEHGDGGTGGIVEDGHPAYPGDFHGSLVYGEIGRAHV